jgi:hypothetical protein
MSDGRQRVVMDLGVTAHVHRGDQHEQRPGGSLTERASSKEDEPAPWVTPARAGPWLSPDHSASVECEPTRISYLMRIADVEESEVGDVCGESDQA